MRESLTYWGDVQAVLQKIPKLDSIFGKTILITGATGMICSAVTDLLLYLNDHRNAGIRILLGGRSSERTQRRFAGYAAGEAYRHCFYDAVTGELETLPCDRLDYIIHGAGNAHPAMYAKEPVETILANTRGMEILLRSALRYEGCRVLYISSSEVYGRKDEARSYSEGDYGYVDILNPRACYPCSKRLAETFCAAYGKEYGLDTVIVRPGHIYGPTMTSTDTRAASQFVRDAVNGVPIVMKSAGTQLRSYCHVLDCASSILTVLLNGQTGDAYNISNPHSLATIREFAETTAQIAGASIVFEHPSDEEKQGYNLMDNSALDSRKIESIGWTGCFDLATGIDHTIKVLKADAQTEERV